MSAYRAIEREEVFHDLVISEDGMSDCEVEEALQGPPSHLNEHTVGCNRGAPH